VSNLKESVVKKYLRNYFQQRGFETFDSCVLNENGRITRTRRGAGADLIARKPDEIWVVEAKGEYKDSAGCSVAFNEGFGQLISRMKIINENIHYGLALPHKLGGYEPVMRRYAGSKAIMILDLHMFLVDEEGKVIHKDPDGFMKFLDDLKFL